LTTLKSQCDQAGLRLSAWIFTDATTSYVSHLANDLGYNIHLDLESYSSMAAGVAYVQSIRAACPGKLFTLVTKSVWDDPAAYNIDLPDMAQYVDAIVPMLYTGDYGKTDSALTSAVQATEQQYPNKVWAALETYESDANPSPKPLSDLQAEVAASQPNCQGVALFRYGLLSGYPSVGQ